MAVLLGGRSAEMLIFNEFSTGAANDLEKVTQLARRMVTEFGMSEALGPVRYVTDAGMGYLGTMSRMRGELSPETATLIDQEVRRLVEQAETQASELLRTNIDVLHEIARTLQEKEVISGEQINQIAAGAKVEQGQPQLRASSLRGDGASPDTPKLGPS